MAVDWTLVVSQIRAGEESGCLALFQQINTSFRKRLNNYFKAHCWDFSEIDDVVSELYLLVHQSIKREGFIQQPERMIGFIDSVMRKLIANRVDARVTIQTAQLNTLLAQDAKANPQRECELAERERVARAVLLRMRPQDAEILIRFYVNEQTPAQIQQEMNLDATLFRLHKSRAKNRFGKIGQQMLGLPIQRYTRSRLSDPPKAFSATA